MKNEQRHSAAVGGASGAVGALFHRVLVWDAPTRLMHWMFVLLIACCWWTGTHNQLDYHQYGGLALLWIVLLRFYWGFVGSSTAKFSSFVRGPMTILRYASTLLDRKAPQAVGHNPLGALSVLFLLAALFAVIGLGLFAVDVDGLYSGPLSSYVSFRTGRHIAHFHYTAFKWLLALIAIHLAAVGFYLFYKRQNLVVPMVSGAAMHSVDAVPMTLAPFWRLVIGGIISSGLVWLVSIGFYL